MKTRYKFTIRVLEIEGKNLNKKVYTRILKVYAMGYTLDTAFNEVKASFPTCAYINHCEA